MMEITCWIADSKLKQRAIRVAKVPPLASLADVVAALGEDGPHSPQYELFAGRRNGEWLRWKPADDFSTRHPEKLAVYMTESSALHQGTSVSVFQSAPQSDSVIHLILKAAPSEEPAQKKPKISLHTLAGTITPSSFARMHGNGGWLVKLKGHHDQINTHRGFARNLEAPLPLALQHPVFASFQDECQRTPISTDDCAFVVELCRTLSQCFDDEAQFADEARRLVAGYFRIDVTPSVNRRATTDGSILHGTRLRFNLECKRERGGSRGDPMMQNVAYYLKHFPQRADGRLPCFLVDLCGPFMTVFGICNTSNTDAVCEPLTHGFPLLCVSNESLMTSLVRTWVALKRAVQTLMSPQAATDGLELGLHSIQFPYMNTYRTENATSTLNFTRRVTRHVFEATCSLTNKCVIVKFAKRYSKPVHDFCHNWNFAPKLLHHEHIAGGRIFVVMEKVENLKHRWPQSATGQAEAQLKELVNVLQKQGFVHGDLRESNVMWDPLRCRIVVLDFDWAGIEGEVKYPPFMNPQVKWAPGVSTGSLVEATHHEHSIMTMLS